ncbi:hypothetical protein BCU90_23905 [Vibrio lentus]|uniref:hypothetical protein n=1 Tax=Vibrio lentus TaxID=136468 RepID=UPI000C85F08C|nr:hypothetical protein [Vibrio lentus]PMG43542.1 hypothetical protein BCU90_23905 [Vibrio lentus]
MRIGTLSLLKMGFKCCEIYHEVGEFTLFEFMESFKTQLDQYYDTEENKLRLRGHTYRVLKLLEESCMVERLSCAYANNAKYNVVKISDSKLDVVVGKNIDSDLEILNIYKHNLLVESCNLIHYENAYMELKEELPEFSDYFNKKIDEADKESTRLVAKSLVLDELTEELNKTQNKI